MFETVKIVNGYEIKRLVGSRGHYTVSVREFSGVGFQQFATFRTIKAATEFAASLPAMKQ